MACPYRENRYLYNDPTYMPMPPKFAVTAEAWQDLQESVERLRAGNVSLQRQLDELRAMIECHPSRAVPLLQPHFEALAKSL